MRLTVFLFLALLSIPLYFVLHEEYHALLADKITEIGVLKYDKIAFVKGFHNSLSSNEWFASIFGATFSGFYLISICFNGLKENLNES